MVVSFEHGEVRFVSVLRTKHGCVIGTPKPSTLAYFYSRWFFTAPVRLFSPVPGWVRTLARATVVVPTIVTVKMKDDEQTSLVTYHRLCPGETDIARIGMSLGTIRWEVLDTQTRVRRTDHDAGTLDFAESHLATLVYRVGKRGFLF